MNAAQLEQIVEAVLYEGYILYPYRPSSQKNCRERFTFGRVYPEAYSLAQHGAEPCQMQTECLVKTTPGTEPKTFLKVTVRFLQPLAREIGVLDEPASNSKKLEPRFHLVPELRVGEAVYQTWHEAIERRVEVAPISLQPDQDCAEHLSFRFLAERNSEPIHHGSQTVGIIVRHQDAIEGTIDVAARPLEAGLFKITVRIVNQSPIAEAAMNEPDAVLLRTIASTHTILNVQGGEFISLLDPPAECRQAAAACANHGAWPVLVGDEQKHERDTMLSSPIILYDYPKLAPESAGSMFDGTEIDEILALRLRTMTDEEKREMRHVDERARQLLERTEALPENTLLRFHGRMSKTEGGALIDFDDFFGPGTPLKGVTVAGTFLTPGDRVRIRPKARADIMDMALEGQIAVIEAVEQDAERRVHLALVLDNDPGKDLGLMRQPGHRFFYGVDEVEPLRKEAA